MQTRRVEFAENQFWLNEISQGIGQAKFCAHDAIQFSIFIYQAAAVWIQTQFHIGKRQIAKRNGLPLGIACSFKGVLCLLEMLDAFGDTYRAYMARTRRIIPGIY
jgi:hypothetical protein